MEPVPRRPHCVPLALPVRVLSRTLLLGAGLPGRDPLRKNASLFLCYRFGADYWGIHSNRHAARHATGHLQQVGLHVDDLVLAVPSVREDVLQAVGVLPDRAVDQAVQVEAMVRSPIRYFVPRTAAPTGLSTAACCQGCFALVEASHCSGRLAGSPPTSHRQIHWAVAHRERT